MADVPLQRRLWCAAIVDDDRSAIGGVFAHDSTSKAQCKNPWRSVMIAAFSRGYVDVVQLLLERGVPIIDPNDDDWGMLVHSTFNGCDSTIAIEHLIANGARVNGARCGSHEALAIAVIHRRADAVASLLRHGTDRWEALRRYPDVLEYTDSRSAEQWAASARAIHALIADL